MEKMIKETLAALAKTVRSTRLLQAIYVPEDVSPGHGPADPGQYVAGRTGRTRHPSLRQNISNDHELIVIIRRHVSFTVPPDEEQ